MTIYTATYHNTHNFGAMLQAYALQQALLSLAYHNEIIDYSEHNLTADIKGRLRLHKFTPLNMFRTARRILYRIAKSSEVNIGHSRFELFYKKHLITTKQYNTVEELKEIKCDALLAGSDQIWNFKIADIYNQQKNGSFYLFNFTDDIPKYSYAASMGGYRGFSNDSKAAFFEALKKFNSISVREEEAQDFLSTAGIKASIHIDPVYLLDYSHWENLAKDSVANICHDGYILCYDLVGAKYTQKLLNQLKKIYCCKIVIINSTARTLLKGDEIICDAGPLEFLDLIRNSKFVVTDSYHGTAFAILFEKPFYSLATSHAPDRLKHLLNLLNLENRIIYNADVDITDSIDFNTCKKIIRQEKTTGIEYLKGIGEAEGSK